MQTFYNRVDTSLHPLTPQTVSSSLLTDPALTQMVYSSVVQDPSTELTASNLFPSLGAASSTAAVGYLRR